MTDTSGAEVWRQEARDVRAVVGGWLLLNDTCKAEVIAVLASLRGVCDRMPPDGRRRGQFKAGWADATKRGQTYSDSALSQITSNNLGHLWP